MQEDDASIDELIQWVKENNKNLDTFNLSVYLPKLFKNILNYIEKIQERLIQLKKIL